MRFNWKRYSTDPAVVGSVSFAAGVVVGYFGYKYQQRREIDAAFEAITLINDLEAEKPTPVPDLKDINVIGTDDRDKLLAERFVETVVSVNTEVTLEEAEEPVVPVMNVFDAAAWDTEAEQESRGPDAPYTLNEDEFHDREKGWPQQTLFWYASDKKLADEQGMIVYDVNGTVGGQLEFGHGSRDPDVVYVRNEKLHAEYAIHRIYSSYDHAVLGLQAEEDADGEDLRHSQTIPRFRNRD